MGDDSKRPVVVGENNDKWPRYNANLYSLVTNACGYCAPCVFFMSGALCSNRSPDREALADFARAIAACDVRGDTL